VYADAGLFLCFEGGEGAGKSTQAAMLNDWLVARGHDVLLTFEPGDTHVGRDIRRIVLDPSTGHLADRTEALLYAADKAEHVEKVVAPALAEGTVVITDRYVDTSLAYQGTGRGIDAAELEHVLRWATGDLRPHLTVLLDVEPSAGLGRFEERDRIEAESLAFHQRARDGFLALAAANPDHYQVLDARADRDEIAQSIRDRVEELLITPTDRSLRSRPAGDPER
jgi:dTMP kinase